MTAISVHQLSKSFSNGRWALDEVSFEIPSGSVAAILGHNGAGKSVLLKILSGVLRPTRGCATVRGSVAPLLEVGAGFHPELSGRENVFLHGALLGMRRTEVERRFDEIVHFSGVEPFLDEPVKSFSSGMFMRLAFAVAVHLDREIFLFDEVLAVGDAAFRRLCLARVSALAAEGRTVLFVSHGSELASLATTAVLLHQGRLIDSGSPRPVFRRYYSLMGAEEAVH
jgi:lipopolysaccharide transport system ATP-binding protein